jgi:outer membrane protein OmpA-like peptidoglycan-associated protein
MAKALGHKYIAPNLFLFMKHFSSLVILLVGILFAVPVRLHAQSAAALPPSPQTRQTTQQSAQEVSGIRFGLTGGYNYNVHSARFLDLPLIDPALSQNIPSYVFQNGTGNGWSAGFLVEVPITSWLNIGLRGASVTYNTTLLSVPNNDIIGRLDGTGDPATFRRRMDVALSSMGAELLFGINPVAGLNIYLGARGELAYTKTYRSWEEIVQPVDGTFENGERQRNQQSGVLPSVRGLNIANFNAAAMGGVGYELTVNPARSWTVEPYAMLSYGLLPLLEGLKSGEYWRVNALRGGVAVRYYPERDAAFDAQDFKVKQLVALEKQIAQERSKIQEQLKELKQAGVLVKVTDVVGIRANGQEVPNPTVRVEQFQASNTVQMLNYIFFNESSSVLPARYRRVLSAERQRFTIESLANTPPLEVYHHILNVIGKRMNEYPQARITLTGCNANVGAEKGNRKVSRQRAESVSDYLQDVWKIAASRISIVERDLPAQPSTADTPEGQAENRRVEIQSDNPLVLQPVAYDNTFRVVEPPTLRMNLEISAGAGLKQWLLEISQLDGRESKTLKTAEGGATYPKQFIWNIDEAQERIPNASGTMDIALSIADITNRNADAPLLSVPVEVLTIEDKRRKSAPDKRIDVFTFGVFQNEVAKSSSDAATQALIQQAKARIKSNSTIIVEGYVEGEDDGSLDTFLSEQRANSIAKALASPAASTNITVKTIKKAQGTTQQKILRNDASYPEGRFYNRSVRVEVQTPTRF